MSALTTVVLGAVLTASTVLAQQSRAPEGAPQGKSAVAGSTPATGSASPDDSSSMYGMAPSRGARHLLRNGLDYLNYQQYERALKFLRDAESRQKELNEPEKLALKQGIERAQRGLREAADAESPYAISERSHRRNGFAPAPAEPRVATNTAQTKLPVQRPKTNRPALRTPLASDGDDPGEPIRLASGETPVNDRPAETNRATSPSQTTDVAQSISSESGQPASMPEIPQIPPISQLTDPTEASGSVHRQAAEEQSPAGSETNGPQTPTTPRQTPVLPAETQQKGQPESFATLPTLVPAPELTVQVQNPTPASAASIAEPTAAKVPRETTFPTIVPTQPANTSPLPEAPKNAPVIDLETIPSAATSPAVDPSAPAHRESEEALPTSAPPSAEITLTNPPVVTAPAQSPPIAEGVDELPVLPPDLGRSEPAAAAPETSASLPATALAPLTATSNAEERPLLPANLGDSDPASPSATLSPVQGNDTLTSSPAATTGALNQPVQTSPAPLVGAPAPIADVERPPASIPPGDTSKPGDTLGATLAPTARVDGSVASEHSAAPTDIELPPLPGAAANSPASTVPTPTQTYPTRNPNLERQAPAMGETSAENTPDVSALPPALPGRMLASSSDSFIPDRANPPSTLRPDLQREIEQIARSQEEEMRRQAQVQPPPAPPAPPDSTSSDLRTQTQLDISRAPSPAEARPIKAIPVPEDWVPLPPRNWSPQRKYWAAAATCHLPLYFQDPVLERYGHSVEQFVGPVGRFLTYPVDDPTQSTQRNQMLQPWVSAGLMGLQIIAWPYNLIMDPPWEAQYDLGYYRPGDNIPTDTYWLPLHGYGPPLRGSNY
jgi:hypothetical protein